MIFATGVTSRVGRELVHILCAAGDRVRALVRDPESDRAVALRNPNLELMPGDLERPETYASLLRGVDKMFLLVPSSPDQVRQEGQILDAARRAGVRLVVKISTVGAGPGAPVSFWRWHAAGEKHLVDSGLEHAILRPSWFMQNLLAFAPQINADRSLQAPLGDARIAMVDVRDVAAAAAAVLSHRALWGRVYTLTGPDAVRFDEVARRFTEVTGHTIRYEEVPPDAPRDALVPAGLPDWLADGLVDVYRALRAGAAAEVTRTVPELTGHEARSFDQFAREHAFTFGA
jgi:uncharacterized protein YbjT (DUF2867 family)